MKDFASRSKLSFLLFLTSLLICVDSIPLQQLSNSSYPTRVLESLLEEDEVLPPLFPFDWTDYLGFGVAVAGLVLAAGGGIGGGGILVPCYILLLEFPVKHAIPLASATVLGGAVANNVLNWPKRHPLHQERSCVDWDLILMMEPMTMAGALVGASLNEFLPDSVLILLLLALLGLTAYKTLQKATKMYLKESEAIQLKQQQSATGESSDEALPLKEAIAMGSEENHYNTDSAESSETTANESSPAATHLEVMDRQETMSASSWAQQKILIDVSKLAILFIVTTYLNLMKGGTGEGGGLFGLKDCGTGCFWFTEISILALIVLFTVHARSTILRRLQEGRLVTSDIAWDESNTVTYSLLAIVAGLVAGMFGIGGGIVKGPLMLALGVHPAVASATSAAMIFFTASTSTASYSVFGLLVYDYAAFCFVVGLFSTFFGQIAMSQLMKKYNRNSYIAYSIGFVVGLSAIAMTIEAV
eukprot:CAMPEP_0168814932 /NCGR_PEP_ID=MMETSP0726-20121227/5937_1 /TAXON_ID=265536 /ORGANISM="Amphiprora sp., Strain CCMP467" /LENGTH=472 /DNA_ID=CAMNT_0008867125 /DNA_START=118 /DNA_END=1533 /DNA_ORIENTATION=+